MGPWTPAATARSLSWSFMLAAMLTSCAQPLTPPPQGTSSTAPVASPTPTPPPIASYPGVSDPRGLAFDASGNLWLTNGAAGSTPAGRILKLTADGVTVGMVDLGVELGACAVDGNALWTVSATPSARLWRIGLADLATESFALATGSKPVSPRGLVVDPEHRVWLADAANDLVSVYLNGVWQREVAVPRATDSMGPTGLLVASDSVWIAAQGDPRLYQRRLSDGAAIGQLDLPKNATGVLGIDKNQLIWAGHAFYQGTLAVAKFADPGTEPRFYDAGQDEPAALVGDGRGYMWAALRGRNLVARITPLDGTLVVYGSDAIVRPQAIAVDGQGNAYVASRESVARIPAAP